DEAQCVDVVIGINAVSGFGAQCLRDEPDGLVVADHLGGNAGGCCCLSDIHATPSAVRAAGESSRRASMGALNRRSLRALPTTKTLESAIAAAATTGESRVPLIG